MVDAFGRYGARPHIVFTLVDDWGWELWPRPATTRAKQSPADLPHGAGAIFAPSDHSQLLPNIKQTFVADGVQLARHYAYSYCAPSRQSLLSGRQPLHVNEENSVCAGIPRSMRTIGDVLQSAGYATHWVGKWHAGFSDATATPSRRGFQRSLGFFMKAHHHFSHCSYLGYDFTSKLHTECRVAPSNRSAPLHDFFEGTQASGDVALGAAHPLVANRTYSTQLFGQAALDAIRNHDAARPLFLFLSLSATHKPYLAPTGHFQRAALAHSPRYYRECAWVVGSPAKCRAHHRKGYEAMAVGVDDLLGEMRDELSRQRMWEQTLMVFASDNGGPIGPQASNLPLRGGKDSNLDGGVRTLAALGGGWLPPPVRGRTSDAFMHESDWLTTLAHIAGTTAEDTRAAARGVPPVAGVSLWPSWRLQLLKDSRGAVGEATAAEGDAPAPPAAAGAWMLGEPRTIVLATRFGLPGTPYGGTSALIDVRRADERTAFKLIRGVVCECPECRPCLQCNTSHGGCIFDLINDPEERHDLAPARPALLANLNAQLTRAMRTKFVDSDPVNQECWDFPKDEPDHWMEVALARGAVMQPWLKASTRAGGKPRLLYPSLHKPVRKQRPGRRLLAAAAAAAAAAAGSYSAGPTLLPMPRTSQDGRPVDHNCSTGAVVEAALTFLLCNPSGEAVQRLRHFEGCRSSNCVCSRDSNRACAREGGGGAATTRPLTRLRYLPVLCDGADCLAWPYCCRPTHSQTAGYFSQLHTVAQSLLESMVGDGRGVESLSAIYGIRLHGYGGAPLGHHVKAAFACVEQDQPRSSSQASTTAPASSAASVTSVTSTSRCLESARGPAAGHAIRLKDSMRGVAVGILRLAPRHQVVSRLLRLVFSPRRRSQLTTHRGRRFDVAVHARRTDKLTARGVERIAVLDEQQLVEQVKVALEALRDRRREVEALREAPAAAGGGGPVARPPRILVASDDDGFAHSLADRLRAIRRDLDQSTAPPSVEVAQGAPRLNAERIAGIRAPYDECDGTCITPLTALVEDFQHADALILSLASNVGGYLLSSWPAANGDALPLFIDTDGQLKVEDVSDGRWFCKLDFGSRAGLCSTRERFDARVACSREALASPLPVTTAACCNGVGLAAANLSCTACPRAQTRRVCMHE